MIASLPMYDWPQVRAATNRLWQAVAAALRAEGFCDVPDTLERDVPVKEQWRSRRLLISQTCGYPLTHEFDGALEVVATPVYGVDGCDGATYSSLIVVHKDSRFETPGDLRGAHATYNTDDSLSGNLALRLVVAPHVTGGKFFGTATCSGGHAISMEMVAGGKADVAAIDCVSFALCQRHQPQIAGNLRVLATSPSAPSLPLVTRTGRPAKELQAIKTALASALASPTLSPTLHSLFIEGLEFTSRQTYDRVTELEAVAGSFRIS